MPKLTRRKFLNGIALVVGGTPAPGILALPRVRTDHTITIKLTKAFGYEPYRVSDLPRGTVIDATGSTWIVQNSKSDPETGGCDTGYGPTNRYPFQVRQSHDTTVIGGTVNGQVPQLADWQATYSDINSRESCNSKAMVLYECPGFVCRDWRFDRCWDGIHIGGHGDADGWLIEHCHFTDIRDDAIENVARQGGSVKDCLLDGVFVGISFANSGNKDARHKEVVLDGVLLRMKMYMFKNTFTHGSPFKAQWDVDNQPRVRLRNNVIAISNGEHVDVQRMQHMWDLVIESANNYFLNLSDDLLSSDYPKSFPHLGGGSWVGFTILQGHEAREYWEKVREKWLSGGAPE